MNVKDIRRENLRTLSAEVGGITALAKHLGKSQSQISHIIGANPIKNIGDNLAAHIEDVFAKPHGWLDKEHFSVADAQAQYQPQPCVWVPIIPWKEVSNWRKYISNQKQATENCIPLKFPTNEPLFAVRAYEEALTFTNTQKAGKDKILVVAPNKALYPQALVIASSLQDSRPHLQEVVMSNNQSYLRSLDESTLLPITKNVMIFGVVCFVLWVLEE